MSLFPRTLRRIDYQLLGVAALIGAVYFAAPRAIAAEALVIVGQVGVFLLRRWRKRFEERFFRYFQWLDHRAKEVVEPKEPTT